MSLPRLARRGHRTGRVLGGGKQRGLAPSIHGSQQATETRTSLPRSSTSSARRSFLDSTALLVANLNWALETCGNNVELEPAEPLVDRSGAGPLLQRCAGAVGRVRHLEALAAVPGRQGEGGSLEAE